MDLNQKKGERPRMLVPAPCMSQAMIIAIERER